MSEFLDWSIEKEDEKTDGIYSLIETAKTKCPLANGEIKIIDPGQSTEWTAVDSDSEKLNDERCKYCRYNTLETSKILDEVNKIISEESYSLNNKNKLAGDIRQEILSGDREKGLERLKQAFSSDEEWNYLKYLKKYGLKICSGGECEKAQKYDIEEFNGMILGYIGTSILLDHNKNEDQEHRQEIKEILKQISFEIRDKRER